jgi:anaerobic selenocysteine-containing dehydrogenase
MENRKAKFEKRPDGADLEGLRQPAIVAAEQPGRRETMEECCKAICGRCASGDPVECIVSPEGKPVWFHTSRPGDEIGGCQAQAIREKFNRRGWRRP